MGKSLVRKTLVGKTLAGGIIAGFLAGGTATAAEIIVHVAPPRPIVEERVGAPGPGYLWIGGYHRWDGRAYIWVPGRWERPPRPHARWVAHHWVRRRGGWVLVEGRWR